MELRDLYDIVSLIGFLLLFAGAGVGGYLVGRFTEGTQRRPSRERSRHRRSVKSAVQ